MPKKERQDGYQAEEPLQKGYQSDPAPLPIVKPPKEGSGSTRGPATAPAKKKEGG
jgi:hypothetical protein